MKMLTLGLCALAAVLFVACGEGKDYEADSKCDLYSGFDRTRCMQNSCDNGNGADCLKYSQDYRTDIKKNIYAKTCVELKYGVACTMLGDIYKDENDPAKAKQFYDFGCDYGNKDGCDKAKSVK